MSTRYSSSTAAQLAAQVGAVQSAKKAPSEAWEFFEKLPPRSPNSQQQVDPATGEIAVGDDWVRCKLCGLEMCQGEKSTTRGMWKHLVVAHKQVYKSTKHYAKAKGSEPLNVAKKELSATPSTTHSHSLRSSTAAQSHAAAIKSEPFMTTTKTRQHPVTADLIDPEELNLDAEGNELGGDGDSGSSPAGGLCEEPESGAMDEASVPLTGVNLASAGGKGGADFSLAALIHKHPALYDPAHPYYKHNEARARIWDIVSGECGQPAEHIRIKWKTMRDRFKKELRRQAINVAANRPTQSMWPHFDEMTFLLPYMKDRQGEGATSSSQLDPYSSVGGVGMAAADDDELADSHSAHLNSSSTNATNYILELAMNSISSSSNRDGMAGAVDPTMDDGDCETIRRWSSSQNNNGASGSMGHHGTANQMAAARKRPFNPGGSSSFGSHLGGGAVNGFHSTSNNHHHHDSDDSSEDELFCRIMMKKLKRMGDETKERAKAKIMDLLCKIQYGD